jgi:hypothetical protein
MKKEIFYYTTPVTKGPLNLTSEIVDLYNKHHKKVGFLLTHRFPNNVQKLEPGYTFNPYQVFKSINTPCGVIQYDYTVVENTPITTKPTYTKNYPRNTVVHRDIIYANDKEVKSRIIILY